LRTPEFLEAEYTQCPKLGKKRAKEGIVAPYNNLQEELEGGRRPEVMEVEV